MQNHLTSRWGVSAQELHGSAVTNPSLSAYNTNDDKLWLLNGKELEYLLNVDIEYNDNANLTLEQQASLFFLSFV